jgi:hypothetical protein
MNCRRDVSYVEWEEEKKKKDSNPQEKKAVA